jgi:hypothetical protein
MKPKMESHTRPPRARGASTMRWLLMIEAEQLLRVVVQDLVGNFLR